MIRLRRKTDTPPHQKHVFLRKEWRSGQEQGIKTSEYPGEPRRDHAVISCHRPKGMLVSVSVTQKYLVFPAGAQGGQGQVAHYGKNWRSGVSRSTFTGLFVWKLTG